MTTTDHHAHARDDADRICTRPRTGVRRVLGPVVAGAATIAVATLSPVAGGPAQANPTGPPPGHFKQVVQNTGVPVTICVNRQVNNFSDNCIGGVGGANTRGEINTPVGEGDFYLNVRSAMANSDRAQTIRAPKDGDTNCWRYQITEPGGLNSYDCAHFGE